MSADVLNTMEIPRAAKPSKVIFDPFNSSATGHQRAENLLSGSTSWRDSRHLKLREQFSSGAGGGKRVADTVGAGSIDFERQRLARQRGLPADSKSNERRDLRENFKVEKDVHRPAKRIKTDDFAAKQSFKDSVLLPDGSPVGATPNVANKRPSKVLSDCSPSELLSPIGPNASISLPSPSTDRAIERIESDRTPCPQIFTNLNIYVNGLTAPLISDHKLKRILAEHGASMSITLGRRTVTHVVVGRPSSNGGSGGGLSGSKIQKEVARKGGCAVNYVTVEWVLESIKARKRLPESRFEALRLAPKGVGRIGDMFGEHLDSKARQKDEKG